MSNALSLIEEHCRAPTNEEICREVKESATLNLARWISDLQREHTFAYSAVTQKANLILNLPEDRKMNEVYDILGRKAVEAARKASLELARARDTEAALDATGAIIIQTTENEYVVNPKDTENVEIYTNETLPVKYRANLGTLKILSDEKVQNVINDVGVIIEKDQYYVIPKE
jgi:hypothetical protein